MHCVQCTLLKQYTANHFRTPCNKFRRPQDVFGTKGVCESSVIPFRGSDDSWVEQTSVGYPDLCTGVWTSYRRHFRCRHLGWHHPGWQRRKWHHARLGAVFTTCWCGGARWRNLLFGPPSCLISCAQKRKWSHPKWRPEVEVPQSSACDSIGRQKPPHVLDEVISGAALSDGVNKDDTNLMFLIDIEKAFKDIVLSWYICILTL